MAVIVPGSITAMFSGGLVLSYSSAGFEPVGWGEAGGFARFHGGQTGEDVLEVFSRVDPQAAAVLDEGVDDGGFFSGVLGTDEEPVLGSELGGPDGVLNEVVVDLDTAVVQVGLEVGPLVEGVGAGFA